MHLLDFTIGLQDIGPHTVEDTGISPGKSGTVAISIQAWEEFEKQDTSGLAYTPTFTACPDADEMDTFV